MSLVPPLGSYLRMLPKGRGIYKVAMVIFIFKAN